MYLYVGFSMNCELVNVYTYMSSLCTISEFIAWESNFSIYFLLNFISFVFIGIPTDGGESKGHTHGHPAGRAESKGHTHGHPAGRARGIPMGIQWGEQGAYPQASSWESKGHTRFCLLQLYFQYEKMLCFTPRNTLFFIKTFCECPWAYH